MVNHARPFQTLDFESQPLFARCPRSDPSGMACMQMMKRRLRVTRATNEPKRTSQVRRATSERREVSSSKLKQGNRLKMSTDAVLVDYKHIDYRGFIFVAHPKYGLLLLHSTHKRKKGPHFQLPGGHIDEEEFVAAARDGGDAQTQLMAAAKAGSARELFEETAIDIRNDLDRLEPAALRKKDEVVVSDKYGNLLPNQLKSKLYFFLKVTDDDFWSQKKEEEQTNSDWLGRVTVYGPVDTHLMLKLSHEHSSFTFASDPVAAAAVLRKHSGGSGSEALLMSMGRKGLNPDEMTKAEGTGILPMYSETKAREVVVETSVSSEQGGPVDLLPEPQRKDSIFKCCFC